MIVLDEQISSVLVSVQIERWCPGAVISARGFRPYGRALDEEIPGYLLQMRQPTFVTINYRHFWKSELAHPRYCIVCLKLLQSEYTRVPEALREVLSQPEFRTKRRRMGKVISWVNGKIRYLTHDQ